MFLILPLTSCITLSILYEKKVEKTVEQTYRIYLEQLLKSINTITAKKNVNFEIDRIQSYSSYVNIDEYGELSGYAGDGDINNRMSALDKIKIDNYVFAVTTNQYGEMEEYQKATPCKVNYIFNLDSQENYDNDLLSNLQFALRDALSRVLKMDGMIPNLLNTQDTTAHDNFVKFIDNLDEKKLFAACSMDKGKDKECVKTDEEDITLDRLEALLSKLKNKPEARDAKKMGGKDKNKEKKKDSEPQSETSLILKSLKQMKDKIDQIDTRIEKVESGGTDAKLKRIQHIRPRKIGAFENENVAPSTMSNRNMNYQPFKFTKNEVTNLAVTDLKSK